MKFTRESPDRLTVRSVSSDGIRIGDDVYDGCVVLAMDQVLPDWPAKSVEHLVDSDFSALLRLDPEVILLGTGARNVFPPRDLVFAMARRQVGFEVMNTAAAARTYNVLASEGRRVATVLYCPG